MKLDPHSLGDVRLVNASEERFHVPLIELSECDVLTSISHLCFSANFIDV